MRAYSMDLPNECSTIATRAFARYRACLLGPQTTAAGEVAPRQHHAPPELWVANYYSARNPLRLSSLVILGVVARMFRCATRSSCWCT